MFLKLNSKRVLHHSLCILLFRCCSLDQWSPSIITCCMQAASCIFSHYPTSTPLSPGCALLLDLPSTQLPCWQFASSLVLHDSTFPSHSIDCYPSTSRTTDELCSFPFPYLYMCLCLLIDESCVKLSSSRTKYFPFLSDCFFVVMNFLSYCNLPSPLRK